MKPTNTSYTSARPWLRSLLLLLMMMVVGNAYMQAQVQVGSIEEGKPYWIRFTMSRGLNLSTRKPAYRTSEISLRNADFTDASQVFYFKHLEGDSCYIYTHNDGKYQYITRATNNWDMTSVVMDDAATLPTSKYRLYRLPLVYDVPNTQFIRISVDGSTNKGITTNRGTVDGMSVAYNSTNAHIYQWALIPWEPLNYLKQALDEAKELLSTAEIGTEYYHVKDQSYIDALSAAWTTANTTYSTLYSAIGDGTPDNSQLGQIQTAWDNLLTAKRTFLDDAYNPISDGRYFIVSKHGDILDFSSGDSYWAKAINTGGNRLGNSVEVETVGSNAHIKTNDYYLSLSNNKYTTDQLQETQTNPQWQKSPDKNRHQLQFRHLGHRYVGIYFNSIGNADGKSYPYTVQTNESYLTYDYDIDFSSNAGPYKLRALTLEDRDNVELINPTAFWELRPAVRYHIINNAHAEAIYADALPTGTLSVPEVIRSPLVSAYHYYASRADAIAGGAEIDTEYGHSDIYVRYDYDNDSSPLDLNGGLWYTWQALGGDNRFVCSRGNTGEDHISTEGNPNDYKKRHDLMQWKLQGGDPYDVKLSSREFPAVVISRTSLSASGSNNMLARTDGTAGCLQRFIITQAKGKDTYQLMGAYKPTVIDNTTGDFYYVRYDQDGKMYIQANTGYQDGHDYLQMAFSPYQVYHIIDSEDKEAINYCAASSNTLEVPHVIKSPLATGWTYYASSDDAIHGTNPLSTAKGNADIYVRYTYRNDSSLLDLKGTTWYSWKCQSYNRYVYPRGDYGTDHTYSWNNAEDWRQRSDRFLWRLQGGDPYRVTINNKLYPEVLISKTTLRPVNETELRQRTPGTENTIQRYIVTQAEGSDAYQLMGAYNVTEWRNDVADFLYLRFYTNNGMYISADRDYQDGHADIQLVFTPYRQYHIIRNDDGDEALRYNAKVTDDTPAVPDPIKSSLIADEKYTYYGSLEDAKAKISPISSARFLTDVYVRYDYDNDESPVDLSGDTYYVWKMPYTDKWIYGHEDVAERIYGANGNNSYMGNHRFHWALKGEDPYHVTIVNRNYEDRVLGTKDALTTNDQARNLYLLTEDDAELQKRYFCIVGFGEPDTYQFIAENTYQSETQYKDLFYYLRYNGSASNSDNPYIRSNGNEQHAYSYNKIILESVAEFTFHIHTKYGNRDLTATVSGVENEIITLPTEMVRRFTDYTFYFDKEFTQPVTTYPNISTHNYNIYVDYTHHEYKDDNGNPYYVFSADYDHAYWFAVLAKPYDHNCWWKMHDDYGLYQDNLYNDDFSVKVPPMDRGENTDMAYAFIGDAYDVRIVNRKGGDSLFLAATDETPIADNSSVAGFYADGSKTHDTWELCPNGVSADNLKIDNFWTTFKLADMNMQLCTWWASPLRLPFRNYPDGTSRYNFQIRYIADRADVYVHIYNVSEGNDQAKLSKLVESIGEHQIFKAGQTITELPDTLVIPGLAYSYYLTEEDLRKGENGVDSLAKLNIVAARPSHDPADPVTDGSVHIWAAYTITEEYPIVFSNTTEDLTWYFIAMQDQEVKYGWTKDDQNANDKFTDLLQYNTTATSWNRDYGVDQTKNGGLTYEDACIDVSDRVDKSKKPQWLLWKFVGDPYGFRIINRQGGDGKSLRAGNYNDNANVTLEDYDPEDRRFIWQLQVQRHTEMVREANNTSGIEDLTEEELPHMTLRLAANPTIMIVGEKESTRVHTWSRSLTRVNSHQYCTRLYKYDHKTYFNVHAHLKNTTSGNIIDLDIPWDEYDFWLEKRVALSTLGNSIKRTYVTIEDLFTDGTYTTQLSSEGINYLEHPEFYFDKEGTLLTKEDYWDYELEQIDGEKATNIWIDLYGIYTVDEDAPIKFFSTKEELFAADPAQVKNAWVFLQMGVGEGTDLGNYYEQEGMTTAEKSFLDHNKARTLNFLCRSGELVHPNNPPSKNFPNDPADAYGAQAPKAGDETVTSIWGARYFHSQDTVHNVNMLSPKNDFRRIAETYMEGTDAYFRESRWLWGFVGDPYGFKIINRETPLKRLVTDVHIAQPSKWNSEDSVWVPQPDRIDKVRLSDRSQKELNRGTEGDGADIWELAVSSAGEGFMLKAYGQDKYLSSTDNGNPELSHVGHTPTNILQRTIVAHPWNWSDSKYKKVTVNIYKDDMSGSPVLTRHIVPQERLFMAGDVIDGTEHHFYLPHEGDENFVSLEASDGHLIDIPFELKRHFCTYEVAGGKFTVKDTDDEQVMNLIYHVQTPESTGNPFIPRFLKEDELDDFKAADEVGDFTNIDGDTRPKSDYYYFLDIGNTLGFHAFINPDKPGKDVPDWQKKHPYDVVDNRFKRDDPTQLQWFFVGDPYAMRIFNVYFTNHKDDAYKDKEFNLARNYHRNNSSGEYYDSETDFNIVYMEEVQEGKQPHEPHGKVYWEMVEPRRDTKTGSYYKKTDANVSYRYDRIKDLPFAIRLTKPHSWDYPDEATVDSVAKLKEKDPTIDENEYKTRFGAGTAFYLTNTANGAGQNSQPYNYNTWGYALYHYRDGKTNPRGNRLSETMQCYPDVRHMANMNPEDSKGTSSMFTAMPVGRVYVTVYDHEDTSTKVTDYELSDYYAITERFKGVPANLQRKYCDYTKVSTSEDMSDDVTDSNGYVEVTDGTAHLYVTYVETKDSPFSLLADGTPVLTDVYGQVSSSTVSPWQNLKINDAWAFFNSNFRGFDYEDGTENLSRVDLLKKYSEDINASKATAADDWRFRKGFSWAFIGDPYNFTLRNKRDITKGDGDKVDEDYPSYTTTPAYFVNTADKTGLEMGTEENALHFTLMRDAAANLNDAQAVHFLSLSDERRTEALGPVNAAYQSSIYTRADSTFNIKRTADSPKYKTEKNHSNYELGGHVTITPTAELFPDEDGKLVAGAGNEGFDAIVSVYNRMSEMVATTGWTELSRQRSEWSFDNNLPADVRRWSCTYKLWADETMAEQPFTSYRDVDGSGEYLIKDGGTVYVTYDYDEAIFSTENEYRWVNPFFNWDDQKKTWPLNHREVYKYTAEQWDYSVKDGGASHEFIMPEANIRTQEVDVFLDKDDPTVPYRQTKEGWLESPSEAQTKDEASPYYGLDPTRAYAYSDHQYKSESRYKKDGQWNDFTADQQTERAKEDMKVQKWALIGDPYKFILYNYYRRSEAYAGDRNAYYLQYNEETGQIVNAELPEADREVAEGEAPTDGYSKEKMQGVFWTWKVDGTGYTYRKRKATATDEQIETTQTTHDPTIEEEGDCSVKLRDSFYETDDDGNRTGQFKTGYLAVCDLTAQSLYNKKRLVGSVKGYVTFEREHETIVTLDGSENAPADVSFNVYQPTETAGVYNKKEYSIAKDGQLPRIGAAYTIGFNDKYKGYIQYDGSHILDRGENGVATITRDNIKDGKPDYQRDYWTSNVVDGVEQNTQYTNFAEWRAKYGLQTYTYTHYTGTPGGEYDEGTEVTGTYYDGGHEGKSLPVYLQGTTIDRDGVKKDHATQGVEPEEEYITFKKMQLRSGVENSQQYLKITGGPSDVENKPDLGNAYRFLVTTMPIHAASITFHLDPEDHGLDNGGRTSKRNFVDDPIYDHVTEDYGIGNDLVLPWLMRRQYCDYKYYLITADGADPQLNETDYRNVTNWNIDDIKYGGDPNGFNTGRLAWGFKTPRPENTSYNTFWNPTTMPAPLTPAKSGQVEVPEAWEDKHVYIRVTYEPNADRWESSQWTDKDPDKVHWYNLMTQKTDDIPQRLMQYTRTNLVRGKNPDQLGHTTNDYLWAVEGDPYGFWLHNRYAAHWHNGISEDNGVTWPEANEQWEQARLTTDYVNSLEKHNYDDKTIPYQGVFTFSDIVDNDSNVTGTKAEYQADVHFANTDANAYGRMLSDKPHADAKIVDATKHAPDDFKLYEAMTGNYRVAMMLHPVKAHINTRDENGIKYYTSYLFNGVNWPVQLNYMLEWMAMRNVYCNWVLTLPSAAQLLPYWERAGYALTLQPDKAAEDTPTMTMQYSTTTIDAVTGKKTTTLSTADKTFPFYKTLRQLRDGDAELPSEFNSATVVGRANINTLLREARRLVHNPKNLVRLEPDGQHMRLMAYSSITDSIHGLGTDRYATAPLHQKEATEGLPLHFYATLEAGRTFDDMATYAADNYGQGNATNFGRDALGLPAASNDANGSWAYKATRGQIPVESATFDPAAIYHIRATEPSANHRLWAFHTQGLSEGQGLYLSDVGSSLASRQLLDVQDIGVGAVQVQASAIYDDKQPVKGNERKDEATDYLSYSPETSFFATKRGTELHTTGDGIFDTRWMLQPVGDEDANISGRTYQRPLCLRVYEDRQTGGQYYYASICVPFDVMLPTGAFAYVPEAVKTSTDDDPTPTYVATKLIGRITSKGNRFVPAGTGVIVRISAEHVQTDTDYQGREYKYIAMTLPNADPLASKALADDVSAVSIAQSVYLEQVLDRDTPSNPSTGIGQSPADGKTVYVFGQYMTEEGEYAPVGFYRNANHNWYDKPNLTTIEEEWYQRYDETRWQTDNLYVRHNKVYVFYDSEAPSRMTRADANGMLPIRFDGEDSDAFTADKDDNAWYTVGGVRLNGAPKRPGVYVRKGKKVVRR